MRRTRSVRAGPRSYTKGAPEFNLFSPEGTTKSDPSVLAVVDDFFTGTSGDGLRGVSVVVFGGFSGGLGGVNPGQ